MRSLLPKLWPLLVAGIIFALLALVAVLARRAERDGWAQRTRVSLLAMLVGLLAGPVGGCFETRTEDTSTCYADAAAVSETADHAPADSVDGASAETHRDGSINPTPDVRGGEPETRGSWDAEVVMCYADVASWPDDGDELP